MAKWDRRKRQRIIDGYLSATGRNYFVPAEFIDWLAQHKDHEAYSWFFELDDDQAAREYRINLARRFAAGIRIVVADATPIVGSKMQIQVREFPAMVSPIENRRSGGGYQGFDPRDPEHRAMLQREGRVALKAWLKRYRDAFEIDGIEVEPLAALLDDETDDEARTA